MKKRNSGILLHISSLPSKYGIGTLGKKAYQFIDWMKESGLSIWQVLPLVPTNYGDSPYQSVCSTALNYYFLDFDILKKKKLLKSEDLKREFFVKSDRVDYHLLFENKIEVLKMAFNRFNSKDIEFQRFLSMKEYEDFALFMTLKELADFVSWNNWPKEWQNYSSDLLKFVKKNHYQNFLFWQWTQFEFLNQWMPLKKYANENGIKIMGDMPLYVAYDSVEVWKNPKLFVLHEDKSLNLVAGCPPDCFTADGQLWGNPVYDWKYMKETNYAWWNNRLQKALELYDILRIDHFRGFEQFYAIEAHYTNARIGEWLDGPSFDLFKDKLNYPIVAEDLGFIDERVHNLMRQVKYPGMKILEFAFDGNKDNEHKPSNYTKNFVAYTGTHDNLPLYQHICDMPKDQLSTLKKDLRQEAKLLNVVPHLSSAKSITRSIIELGYASIANTVIIPIQDYLCLDGSSRMNLPATVSTNNWSFRINKNVLSKRLSKWIKDLNTKYSR